ncbi:MAG TPA: hypothetical protein PLN21_15035 [Gemmatales bacterium]|nr:hypothetical protein [Gemmatales bacterium]
MSSRYLIASDQDRSNFWHIVFVLNLLVPGPLGFMETQSDARWGLLVGIVLLWYSGLLICKHHKLMGTALIWGGVFVGLFQIIPMAHFYLGMWALAQGKTLEPMQNEYVELASFLGGLSTTCIMGVCLMVFSLVIGIVVLALSELATPMEKKSCGDAVTPTPQPKSANRLDPASSE